MDISCLGGKQNTYGILLVIPCDGGGYLALNMVDHSLHCQHIGCDGGLEICTWPYQINKPHIHIKRFVHKHQRKFMAFHYCNTAMCVTCTCTSVNLPFCNVHL